MGIPGLYSQWLRDRELVQPSFTFAMRELAPDEKVCVCIDMNTLIHEIAQYVFGYGNWENRAGAVYDLATGITQLKKDLGDALKAILTKLGFGKKPLQEETIQGCVLCIDGVAPAAKTAQQRQRRFGSKSQPVFDKNLITPGTDFMRDLHIWLQDTFLPNEREYFPETLIYSSYLDPGEGEHKMFRILRENQKLVPLQRIIVWGKDADLVVLSIMQSKTCYVVHNDTYPPPGGRSYETVVDIPKAKVDLERDLGPENIGLNFALLMCFVGNDFIPKLPSMQDIGFGISRILTIANIFRKDKPLALTDENGNIHWNVLADYIELLTQDINALWDNILSAQVKFPFEPFTKFTSLQDVTATYPDEQPIPVLANLWYTKYAAERNRDYWEEFIQNVPDEGEEFLANIDQMVENYLTTLAWVVLYYLSSGESVNRDWYYPHFAAPFLEDIHTHCDIRSGVPSQYFIGHKKTRLNDSFTPYMQLVSVLPEWQYPLVPTPLQGLFTSKSFIYDLMVTEFVTENGGTNVEHANISVIPFVERNRIRDAVTPLEIPEPPVTPPVSISYPDAAKERRRRLLIPGRGRGRGRAPPRGGRVVPRPQHMGLPPGVSHTAVTTEAPLPREITRTLTVEKPPPRPQAGAQPTPPRPRESIEQPPRSERTALSPKKVYREAKTTVQEPVQEPATLSTTTSILETSPNTQEFWQ